MPNSGRCRVVIENVKPEVRGGYPIKRIIGETIIVTADLFADGNDPVTAQLLYKKDSERAFSSVPMISLGNDRWQGTFKVGELGCYDYTVEGSIDPSSVSRYPQILQVIVDRKRARFSAWYKQSDQDDHLFSDPEQIAKIAQMGFDLLLLSPIDPLHDQKVVELRHLIKTAEEYQIEIALTLPFHDTASFHFDTEEWESVWSDLKNLILFWIKQGIQVFGVDRPDIFPFAFWEWLMPTIKEQCPKIIFLSKCVTRPKVMTRLAKIGFTQSSIDFTSITKKEDLTSDLTQMMQSSESRHYFRPNFWLNSSNRAQLILAATLSSNYGIDENQTGSLTELIEKLNWIRRGNSAFHATWNLTFCDISNEHLIAYIKRGKNPILVVVNLDPTLPQSGTLTMPLQSLSIGADQQYEMHDLLTDQKMVWQGGQITLDLLNAPAYIFHLRDYP